MERAEIKEVVRVVAAEPDLPADERTRLGWLLEDLDAPPVRSPRIFNVPIVRDMDQFRKSVNG